LKECSAAFGRAVPNYRLNSIVTVGDVIAFYQEPWESQLRARDRPLFSNIDFAALPSNLRIHL
jgi:hypothetical protein